MQSQPAYIYGQISLIIIIIIIIVHTWYFILIAPKPPGNYNCEFPPPSLWVYGRFFLNFSCSNVDLLDGELALVLILIWCWGSLGGDMFITQPDLGLAIILHSIIVDL